MIRAHRTPPIVLCLSFILLLCVGIAGCASHTPGALTEPSGRGVVVADHGLAMRAGQSMLDRGGNAVDAAVAASLALSVVRPDACGIGGGGFMVIHLEDDPRHGTRDIALNYRETCPAGIGPGSYENWNNPTASRLGGRAVGVPGTVAGLLHALENYGTLDRATVFAPAIEYAMEGWPADGHHVRTAAGVRETFENDPETIERFGSLWDALIIPGGGSHRRISEWGNREDLLQNVDQGRALIQIARQGRDAFYEGSIADAIVASVKADGGVLTHEDLAGYTVQETEPIRVDLGPAYGNKSMLVMPPPSSGGIAIAQMFGLLGRLSEAGDFTMPATGLPDSDSARVLIESMKHAFADRSRHLSDPAFVNLPIDAMLDAGNLDRVAASIREGGRLPINAYGIVPAIITDAIPVDGGTSHISVVDGWGNAVACTETINLAFGSKLTAGRFGFCLNNQMDDFTTVRGKANAFGLAQSDDNLPEPGKRPLSSMSPTIVLDDQGVFAVAGASGGPRIINATAQSLLRVLLADASADEAVNARRLHHQWQPDTVYTETWEGKFPLPVRDGTEPDALQAALGDAGYTLKGRREIGACQLIRRLPAKRQSNERTFEGVSDHRKNEPRWDPRREFPAPTMR